MSGIPMLDGNEGSRRRAQWHGLPSIAFGAYRAEN